MQLRIFTEPQQGASYDDLLAVARTAERVGFDGFFRSDHYLKMGDVSGLPGPTHAWVTLAGLARDTETIRLGTLVSPITFYEPGPLAIMVAQVDAMSGGRVEFGFGAGWYADEHTAYGLDFGASMGERISRMEEALEQMVGLWTTPEGETFSHDGQFATFVDSPGLPKPSQRPHPPIIIGGRGPKRTPAMVARYAAEYNVPFVPPAEQAVLIERVQAACAEAGRAPGDLATSAAVVVCVGADEAEVTRRAEAIGREAGELRENGVAGTPAEVIERINEHYGPLGLDRLYLQVLDLSDLDHLELIAAEVMPHV
ncbi:MAG: LLM class F420-dependent oxidoreductase [Acidimicrobiales bacterium]